jgi:PKD repeat protein
MRHRFTKSNMAFNPFRVRVFLLLAAMFAFSDSIFAQYQSAYYQQGCGWANQRYNPAIEEVEFVANGKTLWRKSADGCADQGVATWQTLGQWNIVTTTPTFNVDYGSNLTIRMNASGGGATKVGIWIDLNRDQDFQDAGEFLGSNQITSTNNYTTISALQDIDVTIPCGATGSGDSRIRIRNRSQWAADWRQNEASTQGTQGETEDYTMKLINPTTLAAGFFMPDTAFVKTVVNFVNNNQSGYIGHEWDLGDDGSVESRDINYSTQYPNTGNYCIRLKSENCLGRDSTIDCIDIVDPVGPPVADFVADKSVVELNDEFQLIDLSTNGAYKWEWFIYLKDDSANSRIDGDNQFFWELGGSGGSTSLGAQNPRVGTARGIQGFPEVGLWSVGLTSYNDNGSNTIIKEDYIKVERGCFDQEMGAGLLVSNGVVIECATGSLMDKPDPSRTDGFYSTGEQNLDALIAPCGATEITANFSQWEVGSNMILFLYDGQDFSGTPLSPAGGFTQNNPPVGSYTAKSGAMYISYSTPGTATDSGFIMEWTSKVGAVSPPVASFDNPGVVTKAVANDFINTSANANGQVTYLWEIDGSPIAASKDLLDQTWFSTTAGQGHQVCLTVTTCAGTNKFCDYVQVEDPTGPTDLDFDADNRRPGAGEIVSFESTADKANSFLWTFFPGNSVTYVNGTNANSPNPQVIFSAAGSYTVSLKAWNNWTPTDSTVSYRQLIKDKFVIVIDYCTPILGLQTSTDISVNSVKLEDGDDNVLINNPSDNAEYTDYTIDMEPVTLTFGGSYDVTVGRNTTANMASRKVWIDYNIDGDFDDARELVLDEGVTQDMSVTGTFTVPDLVDAFEGPTRMRVAISYGNDPNESCGAGSGVKNANRIGEFEDYPILLSNDFTQPILTMNGSDTVFVELNKPYNDAGAVAIDPTEGDISDRIKTTSDVDTTAAGIYYIQYNVQDASGNPAPEQERVVYVVVDQTPPVLTLTGNDTVYVDVLTGTYNEPGYTAIDARDGDISTAVQVTGSVNTFQIGSYTLTYTVQDAQKNEVVATRTVIVEDNVFPVLENSEIIVENGRNIVQVELTSVFVDVTESSDNYNDGVIAPRYTLEVSPATATGEANVDTRVRGTTVVTYTATDESGNQTVLVIDYVVEDFTAPEIDLNTFAIVRHPVNTPYTPVEPDVTDNIYDETQVSLTRSSNVNPFVIGDYQDTYTATDASGNTSTVIRTVSVYDGEKPVIEGKNGPMLKVGLWSTFDARDFIIMTDNYALPAELEGNLKVLSSNVNTWVEGVYTVVFQTSDNSGNVSEPFTLLVDVKDGYQIISSVGEVTKEDMFKVYPNPTAGVFNIAVDLPSNEEVDIAVYDMIGNRVESVVSGELQRGTYTMDMSDAASGVYFVRMNVSGAVLTKRVVLK